VLAAILGRDGVTAAHPAILIAPDAAVSAWAQTAAIAAAASSKVTALGPFPSRAAHHLATGRVQLIVTTIAVAAELIRRSTLKPESLSALILAWPELELSEESFVPLFADLPKETQRLIITADPPGTAALTDRYAWRAPLVGPLGAAPIDPALPRLRSATTSWEGRATATAAVADLFEVDQLAIWTADRSSHRELIERLASHGVTAAPLAGEIPTEVPTVFFDAPPPELLGQAAPDLAVALVPPGTEGYFTRIVGRLDPVRLASPIDHAERAILDDRKAIRERLEAGPDRGGYATVAPLLERWSAAEVAVALHSLWTEARSTPPAAVVAPRPRPLPRPKIWINVGRKDGATHGELLAFLSIDLGLGQSSLGRIEMKETFTLIEVGADDGQRVVDKLAGQTFKGRRIAARIDRGQEGRR
jgi:ATP-dependent RNA helicase DeaD